MSNYITFIIPTLDRHTLKRTLDSLYAQTDLRWDAIVVHDGNEEIKKHYSLDGRILHLGCSKQAGGAGIVRNLAFPFVESEWIGFVDDDDFLDKSYISRLRYWDSKGFNLVQFTYRDVENGNTQPPSHLQQLVACNFGISFAVKNDFVKSSNVRFTPGGIEDYRFLRDCLEAEAKYKITHEILYFVGHRSAWQ